MIKIKKSEDCCGCSACLSICNHNAIVFKEDVEGFKYPMIEEGKCINCGLCEMACPILYRKVKDIRPTPKAYFAARHKNIVTLRNSSSGGAFTAIAGSVIELGGVVCGVEYDNDGVVRHSFSETMEGIGSFMGSKYVQSEIQGVYNQIKTYLKSDRWFLFTGSPCQVEGLKLFLRKPYENLLTVDLVCHAVPSPLIYKQYINMCSTKLGQKVMSINMRYKQTYGWSHRFSYCFYFENGQKAVDPVWVVNWGKIFFSQMINRPSCHSCKYSNLDRPGDFTIADFWDDKKNRPDLYSCEGTSLLMVNTNMGLDLINKLYDSIDLWKITKDEAMQPCLIRPTCSNQRRQEFWEFYLLRGFDAAYKKYFGDSKYVITKKIVKQIVKRVLRKLQ